MEGRVVTNERGRKAREKRAENAAEAARLRREADLLEVASHPGLVELLAFHDGSVATATRLSTGYLEGSTLASPRLWDAEEVAGVIAAVTSTLADLHAMGLVHGAVAPEHVLLDSDGRPVLCSLGYGGLAGELPPSPSTLPAPFADPSRAGGDRLDPSMDVYGVGAILETMLVGAESRAKRAAVDALRRLAGEAMAAERGDRPTARALADAVHDAVLGARLPRGPAGVAASAPTAARAAGGHRQRPLEHWRREHAPPAGRRWGRIALAGAGVAVVVVLGGVAALALRAGDAGAPAPQAADAPWAASSTAPAPPSSTALVPGRAIEARGPAGCPRVESSLSADTDGDGCAEAVTYAGGIVESGGRRWAVGQAGDLAAVGDWTCAGAGSLAVLRPTTGQVFAFERWAGAGGEATAPLVAQVGGARALRASDLDGDGCHELVVERATGAPTVLRAPRPGP